MTDCRERVPMGSWKRWYILVISLLLLQIILYYFLTRHFS